MPMEFGPPFVDKPARELLGDVLLRIDRPREAAAAYEAALRRTPGRAAALRGRATRPSAVEVAGLALAA